jgi:hypothetical protein
MNKTLILSMGLSLLAASAWADQPAKGKGESVEDLLEQAGRSAAAPAAAPAPAPAPAVEPKAEPANKLTPKQIAAAREAKERALRGANGAAHVEVKNTGAAPPPTGTDDNDATSEAARPEQLQAVQSNGAVRRHGPYELGRLDCRILDGAGIERLLPRKIVAGEEPDILCRIIVTQPADVASEEHTLSMAVSVGSKETFRQVRKVRISNVGRRAMVFIIPSDKIASDDTTKVKVSAQLSAPAMPGTGQAAEFTVETQD